MAAENSAGAASSAHSCSVVAADVLVHLLGADHELGDREEALDRVVELDWQRREHRRHPVAELACSSSVRTDVGIDATSGLVGQLAATSR